MKKILIAFGTRPEIIKLAPVIRELKQHPFEVITLHTGQHEDLAEPMLNIFGIEPDFDLNIMKSAQDLFDLTSSLMPKIKSFLKESAPDAVFVQGDTSSAFLTALASFYLKIPVYHVEAGLRSHNHYYPFPEEANRKLITQLASIHFAPTGLNKKNLLAEGIDDKTVFETGNTVIDALHWIKDSPEFEHEKPPILSAIDGQNKLVVLTAHRRENHGNPLKDILKAVKTILEKQPDTEIVYPVHPNPAVKKALEQAGIDHPRFHAIDPLDYLSFLHLLIRANLILTDSGGVQEEAAALAKHVLVLRNETEREELIQSGLGKLVGTDTVTIVEEAVLLLNTGSQPESAPVFGDGKAAERIRKIIERF